MTTKEAIYLLRNTAWLAPSLEPIDEAIDMACEALRKTEPQTCEECEHWNDIEDGCADRHGCKTEPQTEYSIGYYTPTNAEILKALEDKQSGKE